jgi:hypothetical protein
MLGKYIGFLLIYSMVLVNLVYGYEVLASIGGLCSYEDLEKLPTSSYEDVVNYLGYPLPVDHSCCTAGLGWS